MHEPSPRDRALRKLSKPGKEKKTRKGRTIQKPSLLSRIENRRAKGPDAVAEYIMTMEHRLVPLLRDAPEILMPMEWILLERRITEQQTRRRAKYEASRKAEQRLEEKRATAQENLARRLEKILASKDPVHAAARTNLTIRELQKAGLKPAQRKAVSESRASALKLTAAAAHLGVPRGTLDRWCKEGLVKPSFTKKARITGAGTVDVRYFLPEDLDKLDLDHVRRRSTAVRGKHLRAV